MVLPGLRRQRPRRFGAARSTSPYWEFVTIAIESAAPAPGVVPGPAGGRADRAGRRVIWTLGLLGILLAVLPAWAGGRIRAEERLLADRFGAEHAADRARTWRLIPGLS